MKSNQCRLLQVSLSSRLFVDFIVAQFSWEHGLKNDIISPSVAGRSCVVVKVALLLYEPLCVPSVYSQVALACNQDIFYIAYWAWVGLIMPMRCLKFKNNNCYRQSWYTEMFIHLFSILKSHQILYTNHDPWVQIDFPAINYKHTGSFTSCVFCVLFMPSFQTLTTYKDRFLVSGRIHRVYLWLWLLEYITAALAVFMQSRTMSSQQVCSPSSWQPGGQTWACQRRPEAARWGGGHKNHKNPDSGPAELRPLLGRPGGRRGRATCIMDFCEFQGFLSSFGLCQE